MKGTDRYKTYCIKNNIDLFFQCKADERCIQNVCIPTGAAMCCPETQVYDEENDQCIPTPICECDFVTQECVNEVCVDLG